MAGAVGAKGQIGRRPVRENAEIPWSETLEVHEGASREGFIF
jgi:hypothetical protein